MLRFLALLALLVCPSMTAIASNNSSNASDKMHVDLPITKALGWDFLTEDMPNRPLFGLRQQPANAPIALDFGRAIQSSANRKGLDGMLIAN